MLRLGPNEGLRGVLKRHWLSPGADTQGLTLVRVEVWKRWKIESIECGVAEGSVAAREWMGWAASRLEQGEAVKIGTRRLLGGSRRDFCTRRQYAGEREEEGRKALATMLREKCSLSQRRLHSTSKHLRS
jgi:hypothetical protein